MLRLWAVGFATSLAVTAASAAGLLEPLQAGSGDLLVRLQGQRLATRVLVVGIDEAAFDGLGRRQPLPRPYLARLLRGIERAGAAVVGVDLDLTDPTAAADDAELAAAIAAYPAGRLVLIAPPAPGAGALGEAIASPAIVKGAAEVPLDADGIIRRVALMVPRAAGPPVPALGLAVVSRLAGLEGRDLDAALRARRMPLPAWQDDRGWVAPQGASLPIGDGLLRINFLGPEGSVLTIPSDAVAALADARAEIARDNPLRGRAVFLGGTFRDSRDFYSTPHGPLPGVEVHATVAHMLLTGAVIRPSGFLASLAFQALFVLAAGLVLPLFRPLRASVICVAGAVVLGIPASQLAFQRTGYWPDFLLPVFVTCVLGVVADALDRRRFRDSFGRYVSREVADQVLAESAALGGEQRTVSILFSDLRGFTTLSETMPAEAVAARLTEYFEVMTAAIFAHRGMVNDFIGDGMIAVFGAPLRDEAHALHAARSAMAMARGLEALNRRWVSAGLPPLRMGIGIHTGTVFAGNIGGAARAKYTVVGDPVNLAARVEGLNKELSTAILVTGETRAAIGDERVRLRDLGPQPIRGRSQPAHVFELLEVDGAEGAGGEPSGKGEAG